MLQLLQFLMLYKALIPENIKHKFELQEYYFFSLMED